MISHSKNILVLVLPYFKSNPVNTLQSNDEKIQRLVDTIKTELDESDIMVMFMGGDDKVVYLLYLFLNEYKYKKKLNMRPIS